MSVTVTRKVSFFFSSDPAAGSQALSTDGDSFSVNLSPPLKIPKNALSCEFYVPQASIWNTSPNISASFSNNTFKFTTSAVAAPGTYTITLPEGLYSLEAIGSYLSAQFVNLSLPANLFTLSGNDSTSQTVTTFSLAGDSIDFTPATSIGGILGYTAAVITAPSAGYNAFSTNKAQLNRNDVYLISGTFISSGGIPINNNALGVMASVPISANPGSLINYVASMPIATPADELIGVLKTGFQFKITNGALAATPTGGGRTTQFWSFVVTLKYTELVGADSQNQLR